MSTPIVFIPYLLWRMMYRNDKTETATPTINEPHNANGVCINDILSSSVHSPRNTNTDAINKASSEITNLFLICLYLPKISMSLV